MAWNWMTSHTLNNVWEVFCMKIKGVDLKDITIRPLPLKFSGVKSVGPLKSIRSVSLRSQRSSRTAGAKSVKGIRFKERDLFLTLFLSGFVLGVLYITMFGKEVVHSTTLLSSYFFSKYERLEFAPEELFLYILKSRLSTFFVLWLTGLTVLGTLASYGYLFWIGASLGITMTTAAMKMGLMGIVLCIACGLPHFILYVPAIYWMLKKICEMSGNQDRKFRQWGNGKKQLFSYFAVGIFGLVLLFAGAFLESYVNPFFLKPFLKKI